MARRSAFENLRSKLEEATGDSGDVDVDITVVVESDGDAAEDIIESTEVGEAEGEAEAVAETEEAAQQETEDMAEMAYILRKYGLNAGMAAMMRVLMPLEAYGISMPAMESLDASGRNQDRANRLAAALEASGEGFWASTANFFKKIWIWIKDQFTKFGTLMGRMDGKIKRAGKALEKRVWAEDRQKSPKKKVAKGEAKKVKAASFDVLSNALKKVPELVSGDIKSAQFGMEGYYGRYGWEAKGGGNGTPPDSGNGTPPDSGNGTPPDSGNDSGSGNKKGKGDKANTDEICQKIHSLFGEDWLKKTLGLKWKETDSLKLDEDNSSFLDSEDEDVKQEDIKAYVKDGPAYKDAADLCQKGLEIAKLKSIAEQGIKNSESMGNIAATFKNKDEDKTYLAMKERVADWRSFMSSLMKIITRTNKVILKLCGYYVSGARSVLSCTKPSGSEADYKD